MNDFFDNQRILQVVQKRWMHFVIVGVVAIVLSAFFSSSMFITPKFRSSTRIYPTNLWVLSNESESERMLEIVNSQDIKLRMFDAFNLSEVYRINRQDPLYLTYMLNTYNTNVGARKTEFETVEISVLDADPFRAAQMCDSIIHFYNMKVRDMHAVKNWEMVEIARRGLEQKFREKDSLMSLLAETRKKYQLVDVNRQAREITRGYVETLASGRESSAGGREVRQLFNNLLEKGAESQWIESRLAYVTSTIDSLTTNYEVYKTEAEKKITYCHVVEKAIPAEKKAYPVRWLIVLFSTFSASFFALLVFVVLDFKPAKK